MQIIIRDSKKQLHEQVYEFYRDAILKGTLKTGYRMPSHRSLASELSVSNNTVIRAYEQLVHEGYVKSEARKGLFVCELEQMGVLRSKKPVAVKLRTAGEINLFGSVVDEKLFPMKEWRKMQQLALDSLFFQYDYRSEQSTLKDNLVKYLFYSRGVVATRERIVVGAGMNVLFSLLAIMLRTTHKKILYEEPGYPKARTIFRLHDYKVKSLPVNEDGIDVARLYKEKADLLFLTPSHQYPTGVVIPIANRLRILKWAKENHAYIIEDDSDCEFQHKSKLIPALQGIDKFNSVIYFGSFSNAIMPSLRIAYMVLPEHFVTDLHEFEFLLNTVPFTSQQTLAYFMERGYWDKHLRKMRKVYREKYYACVHALKETFGEKIIFSQHHNGLNILLQVKTSLSERQLMSKAAAAGVIVTPASSFYADKNNAPSWPQILFEFSSLSPEQIPVVIGALYKAWYSVG